MEKFITGIPSREFQIRTELREMSDLRNLISSNLRYLIAKFQFLYNFLYESDAKYPSEIEIYTVGIRYNYIYILFLMIIKVYPFLLVLKDSRVSTVLWDHVRRVKCIRFWNYMEYLEVRIRISVRITFGN